MKLAQWLSESVNYLGCRANAGFTSSPWDNQTASSLATAENRRAMGQHPVYVHYRNASDAPAKHNLVPVPAPLLCRDHEF